LTFERRTVGSTAHFEGLGLHSGEPVRVSVHPGGDGIAFRFGTDRVPARAEHVTDTSRCTRLGPVSVIEHILAALAGLEITDVEIETTAAEMPALDGAAKLYVEGLVRVGTEAIGRLSVEGPFARVFLQEDSIKVAIASGTGHWRYDFDCGDRWPGFQMFEALDVVAEFSEGIAPARTFAFSEEILPLLDMGFAKGLGPDTALILGDEGYKGVAKFPDEPARHKLLDCLGDLALSEVPARALNVVAERSGHRTNIEAARLLAQAVTIERA